MIAIDMHVHIYPCHDAAGTLRCALQNLSSLAPDADALAMVLTDRSDCETFKALAALHTQTPGMIIEKCGENLLRVPFEGVERPLWVLNGGQFATAERLEVLSLGVRPEAEDGQGVEGLIRLISEAGGVPVLPWAVGKWMGPRAAIVERVLKECASYGVRVADSAMRFRGCPIPEAFRTQTLDPILAGSDPLPLKREEPRAGSYGVLLDAPFDAEDAYGSIMRALSMSGPRGSWIGRRLSMLQVAGRQIRLSACKKRPIYGHA